MNAVFEKLDRLKPVYDRVYKITMVLCKVLLITDILVAAIQVVGRYITFIPDYTWTEEVILTCMVYMALISASMALRRNAHIRMTALDKYLPATLIKVLNLLADGAVFAFAIILLVYGLEFVSGSKSFYTSMPFLPKAVLFASVPTAGIFIIIFQIETVYNHIKAFFIKSEKEKA